MGAISAITSFLTDHRGLAERLTSCNANTKDLAVLLKVYVTVLVARWTILGQLVHGMILANINFAVIEVLCQLYRCFSWASTGYNWTTIIQ